ncbi:MAG TPA: hypothetical protein VG602_02470, partial [Actinomycetota bacterium]|nr:hypothetical protein [Actinomycetota bacterium]
MLPTARHLDNAPAVRRRVIRTLATTLLVLTAVPSLASESASSPDHAETRFPPGVVVASSSDTSPSQSAPDPGRLSVLGAIEPSDPRTYLDAVRASISKATGLSLPDLRPQHSRTREDVWRIPGLRGPADEELVEPEPPPPPPPEPAGTRSYPSPGGDLTGDGTSDVLVFEITLPEETLTLRALSGSDGAELWSRSLAWGADAIGYPLGNDLNGDGIDDLLVYSLEITSETQFEDCTGGCRYEYDATYVWHVGLRSGADGARLWSRSYPGHVAYRSRTVGSTYTETIRSSNYNVFAYSSGDHDRDGGNDVVVSGLDVDYDIEERWAYPQHTGSWRFRSATRTEVLRGSDGSLLAEHEAERAPRLAYIHDVGDLVGGPAPDLLFENVLIPDGTYNCLDAIFARACPDPPEPTPVELEVVDGQTLAPAWRTRMEGVTEAFTEPLHADLSGDGRDDILLYTFTDRPMPFGLRLVSGGDGRVMWDRLQQIDIGFWETAMLVGPFGGGPGNDLLLGRILRPHFSEHYLGLRQGKVGLARVEGATGLTIFETVRHLDTVSSGSQFYDILTYAWGGGDTDGDGTGDVYIGALGIGYEPRPNVKEAGSSTLVESGRTGAILHQRRGPSAFTLWPGPDLDGDGRDDGLTWTYPVQKGGEHKVTVHTVSPSVDLWQRAFTYAEPFSIWDIFIL